MPRPARFSHAVLQSFDMQRLWDWYREVFDLEVTAESARAVIATYDDEHHRFAFTQLPGSPVDRSPAPPTLKHLAYAYGSLADLVSQYRRLKDLGMKPKECVNHGPTLSFYYEDPDGNGVEFFVDRFATMEESKAFMRSPAFSKNLFGYLVDPEVVADQFDRGVPDAEIMAYDEAQADAFLTSRS